MVSSISQVISKRIDQARPVLFLIWGGKNLGVYQKVDNEKIDDNEGDLYKYYLHFFKINHFYNE